MDMSCEYLPLRFNFREPCRPLILSAPVPLFRIIHTSCPDLCMSGTLVNSQLLIINATINVPARSSLVVPWLHCINTVINVPSCHMLGCSSAHRHQRPSSTFPLPTVGCSLA